MQRIVQEVSTAKLWCWQDAQCQQAEHMMAFCNLLFITHSLTNACFAMLCHFNFDPKNSHFFAAFFSQRFDVMHCSEWLKSNKHMLKMELPRLPALLS
jgi:hypothetical protein